ncbi:fructan 6-exohydrolase-like protein [Tanacetum coccineum]
MLTIKHQRSSTRNELDKMTYGAYVDLDPQQEEILLECAKVIVIFIRLEIDHSIVESFGGGGKTCITARVYPTLTIRNGAMLFSFNNGTESVVISKLNAWSVKKARINIDEETIRCAATGVVLPFWLIGRALEAEVDRSVLKLGGVSFEKPGICVIWAQVFCVVFDDELGP